MGELIRMEPEKTQTDFSIFIYKYLDEKIGNPHTRKNYMSDLKDYFRLVRSKELNELSKQDFIVGFTALEEFKKELKNKKGSSGKTIERKLTSVKGFFKYLAARQGIDEFDILPEIDISFFSEVSQPSTVSKGYATIEFDEAKGIADYLYETEREKRLLKKHLINFGLDTGLRLAEVLKIRCSDFQDRSEEEYFIKVKGKFGKWNERWCKKYFIDRIMEDLNLNILSDEKLFDISVKTVEEMMQRLSRSPKYRNIDIVFHSIRGAAITEFYYLTRDPLKTMEYANHKSFDTTKKYIIGKREKFTGTFTNSLSDDMNLLNSSDPDKLLIAIKQSSPHVQRELAKLIKSIN